jgi:hypothetical protein
MSGQKARSRRRAFGGGGGGEQTRLCESLFLFCRPLFERKTDTISKEGMSDLLRIEIRSYIEKHWGILQVTVPEVSVLISLQKSMSPHLGGCSLRCSQEFGLFFSFAQTCVKYVLESLR